MLNKASCAYLEYLKKTVNGSMLTISIDMEEKQNFSF